MPKHLISLISDQTIPNVLFIKEYEGRVDGYIFVTTERMEQQRKLQWILKATGILQEEYQKVLVVEDQLDSIEQALDRLNLNYDDEFVLNLTGGTKIMSIGVYNYFSHRNSEIFYIPIGKNLYRKIFPPVKNREFSLGYRTDLQTYLTSYGIEVSNPADINRLLKPTAFTRSFFENNYSRNKLLTRLFNARRAKQFGSISRNEIPKVFAWLSSIQFPFDDPDLLNDKEVHYLLGGWLEEYTYTYLKKQLNLSDDSIGIGVLIRRQDVSNEFDVMFVHDNAIYVFECKTGLTKKNLYEAAVYKLAALKKDFGLFVNSYIVTMTKVTSEVWQNRAALFNIKLIDNLQSNQGKEEFKRLFK